MTNIVDLAAYRSRRAAGSIGYHGNREEKPPDDEMRFRHQVDGSYHAMISGTYAEDSDLAVEVLADALLRLVRTKRIVN